MNFGYAASLRVLSCRRLQGDSLGHQVAMEFDLARFRGLTNADQFVATLEQACDLAMTDDFWSIALPNDLATSSPRSPSLFAYNAALVLLDARALFSKLKIADLLDPSIQAPRAAVERSRFYFRRSI